MQVQFLSVNPPIGIFEIEIYKSDNISASMFSKKVLSFVMIEITAVKFSKKK